MHKYEQLRGVCGVSDASKSCCKIGDKGFQHFFCYKIQGKKAINRSRKCLVYVEEDRRLRRTTTTTNNGDSEQSLVRQPVMHTAPAPWLPPCSSAVDSENTRPNVSLRLLAYLNKPELPSLLLGSIAAVIHGEVFTVFGLFLTSSIHVFTEVPNKLRKDSRFWALILVGLGLIALVSVVVQHFLFGVAGAKLIEHIRSWSFEKVVHQDIGWFKEPENSSGAIGARLSSDASTVQSLVRDALELIV